MTLQQIIMIILVVLLNCNAVLGAEDEDEDEDKGKSGRKKAATISVNDNCPFFQPKSNELKLMINDLVNSLRQFERNCPSISKEIENLNNSLSEPLNPIVFKSLGPESITSTPGALPNPLIDQVELTCGNFNSVLTREFSITMERIEQNQSNRVPTRYSSCQGGSVSNKMDCVKNIYSSEISTALKNCKTSYGIKINKNLQNNLESVAKAIGSASMRTDLCPKGTSKDLLIESGIAIINSVSVISGAFGWAGVSMNVISNYLASFLKEKKFKDSPVAALQKIAGREEVKKLNCLWFQFQNKNLNCVSTYKILNLNSVGTASRICPKYYVNPISEKGLTDLSTLLVAIQSLRDDLTADISDTANKEKNNDNKNIKALNSFYNLFNKEIVNPDNESTRITLIDHLKEMASTLKGNISNGGADSILQGVAVDNLEKLIKLHADMSQNGNGKFDPKSLGQKTAELDKILSNLDFDYVAEKYWEIKGNSDSFNALKVMGLSNSNVARLNDRVIEMANIRDIQDATNIIAKFFKEPLENNLKILNETYQNSLREGKNVEAAAVSLAKACLLNAGIFYSGEISNDEITTKDVLRWISPKPSEVYNKNCGVLNCKNDPIWPIFSSTSNNTKEISDAFQKYQCQTIKNLDVFTLKIHNNIKEFGQICRPD